MKERLKKETKKLIMIVAFGIIYCIFVSVSGYGIPCIINLTTGLQCPGCGITRMFVAMAHMDFKSAFSYNPAIFTTLPIITGCIAYTEFYYIKTGIRKIPLLCTILLSAEAVVLLTYCVIRNIA